MRILISFIFILSLSVQAKEVLVKFKSNLNTIQVNHLEKLGIKKLGRLTPFKKGYFKNLFKLSGSKEQLSALEKLKFVESVEDIISISSSSIDPNGAKYSSSNDPFANYQWSLKLSKQAIFNEVTDIINLEIKNNINSDIAYSLRQDIDSKLERDLVVAVIDSGIDLTHRDLKDSLYKNEVECLNGTIPFAAKIDKDNNGYKGDCSGWDFTSTDKNANRPNDEIGHGTHVSGIIAAQIDNEIGISGLSSKIKILPLKIFSKKSGSSPTTFSDRAVKAILYATSMKVDVINLSLGWPLRMDRPHLREAIKEAYKAGITIIAAAGNNNHNAPIFPCAYKEVLCVASSDPDLTYSAFSNYGGHVDLVAPGNNILSSFPNSLESQFFASAGYEIKSGTSQAAPMVSALAALLKGTRNYSHKDLKRNLLANSLKLESSEKYSNFGLVKFDRSLQDQANSSLSNPIFKELYQVLIDDKMEFNFDIEVEKLGKSLKTENYKIFGDGSDVSLNISSIGKTLNSETLHIKGKILNTLRDRKLKLNLKIGEKSFRHEIALVNPLDINSELFETYNIQGADPKKAMGLRTLEGEGLLEYYLERFDKKDLEIDFFKEEGLSISSYKTIKIKNVEKILNIFKKDIDSNKTKDYVIRYIRDIDGKKEIRYGFYDEMLNPLFKKNSDLLLKFEGVLLDALSMGLVPCESNALKKMKCFTFLSDGPLAKVHQSDNHFDIDETIKRRIYYFVPEYNDGSLELVTKNVDTKAFFKKLRKALKISEITKIEYLGQQDQTIVLAIGTGFIKKYYKMKLIHTNKFQLEQITTDYAFTVGSLILAQQLNSSSSTIALLNPIDEYRFEMNLNISGKNLDVSLEQKDLSEPLLRHVKTFVGNNQAKVFFQTKSKLVLFNIGLSGKVSTDSYPVHVSSFLSNLTFIENHFPVKIAKEGVLNAALMVDASQIVSRSLYIETIRDNRIISPLSLSFEIPKRCIVRNPVRKNGGDFLSILCANEDKGVDFKYIPVKF